MVECEICGRTVEEIHDCKDCGTVFCENCGDTASDECEFCVEDE